MNIDKPSLLLHISLFLSLSLFPSLPLPLQFSLFFQRWRVRRIREAETNRMRRRDARRDIAGTLHPFAVPAPLRYHCPRHNASPLYLSSPHPLSYSNSLYLSIFLRLDAIELLRKYISSDSRNGGKRGDTAAPSPCLLDAIFTCGGGEEITVKAREFAFVEISRIPADTTPLFPSVPLVPIYHSHLCLLSSGFRHNLYIFGAESFYWI